MKTKTKILLALTAWALAAPDGFGQPVITKQPANATIEIGQTYTNGVATTSPDSLFQWYFNGEALFGQTSSTLTIPNVQTNHAGHYWVVMTDFDGSVTSRVATLFIGPGTTFTKITQGDIVNDIADGAGCAWGDFDRDGHIDLFVTSGRRGLGTNNLYRSNRDGTFTKMTPGQVGGMVGLAGDWLGCAWADYDNDGWLDMVIAGWLGSGGRGLFRNNGNETFSQVTNGLAPGGGYGVSWADYDRDGWLDLLMTPAVNWQITNSSLYHHQGDGTFTQVTNGPIPTTETFQYLAAWSDVDNDGDLDVATTDAYRSCTVFLYRNEGGGLFTLISDSTLAIPFVNPGPMCPSWGDYDNDGLPDLFLAGYNVASRLYRNVGDGQFINIPFGFPATYAGQETRLGIWGDYDNDGDLDLFVTGGNTIAGCKSLLFANNGDGTFSQILGGSPVNDIGLSSGCLWGDYDNDGFLDLFVKGDGGQGSRFYRNNGNGNSWLMLKLEGTASNRSAIGAKVRVLATLFGRRYWQMREISGGHVCQSDLRAHFGLGDATRVETLLVEWPSASRRVTQMDSVSAGQILTIVEPTNDLPTIVIQPADQTNYAGTDATFCVTASGTPPLTYQWRHNVNPAKITNLPGETNPCLVLTNVQPGQHLWQVSVAVCNSFGCVTSRVAVLTVRTPPYFTNQPTDQIVCLGDTYINSAQGGGDTPLSLQWYFVANGATNLLPGKTTSTLSIANVQFTNAGGYFVVATNRYGTNISSVASLQVVTCPPAIVVQPTNATVELGLTYNNSVVASGSPPLAYQWYFVRDGLTNRLDGMTSSTISIPNVQFTNSGGYLVLVTSPYGAETTRVATLDVFGPGATFTRVTGSPWDTDLGACFTGVVGDYDNDGDLDLFVSRYRQGRSTLYENLGDGTFRSVTNSTFPLPVGDYNFGPCSDFDNDGRVDLFVIRLPDFTSGGPAWIYYSNDDGTFTPVLLDTPVNPWWENAVDYDHDGLLDIYMTCNDFAATNRLYRNLDGRSFQRMSFEEVGWIVGMARGTFGNAAWVDYNDDGWEDVILRWGGSTNTYLFTNNGAGQFLTDTNTARVPTVVGPFVCAWGDFDNDGEVDLAVGTSQGRSAVYRNLGGGAFERVAIEVGASSFYNGVCWGDYDNDGFLDLFMTYGNNTGNSLFRNNGDGTFSALHPGPVVNDRVSTGGAYAGLWFDYDNDGFLDLFVPNGNDAGTAMVPNFLYHNDGNTNAWLKVKLVGTASNRDAAGAKVRVKATFGGTTWWQRRDITSGGDPYAGSGPTAHFGLRDATIVETLLVEWPSGTVTVTNNVPVRQTLTLTEPPGIKPVRVVDGACQFELIGHVGQAFEVMMTTDIAAPDAEWEPCLTVTNTSRTMRVTDPSPIAPQRFYKAKPTP